MRENRFRFVNYKEAIKRKVIISLKSSFYVEQDESLDSYFALSVERWSSSSSSEELLTFRKKIAPYSISLKLVHLHQERLVNELVTFIQSASPSASMPFLDLVGSLCCDLREDFLSYLDVFLPKIFQLIQIYWKDGDILQQAFNCLSHLIYFLHRPLVRDISNTLSKLSPLFVSNIQHVLEFSAECLAFLLRKVPDRREMLFAVVQLFPANCALAGVIMTEVLRGSSGNLHTTAYDILPFLIDLACGSQALQESVVRKGVTSLIKKEHRTQAAKQVEKEIDSHVVSAVVKETLGRLLRSIDVDGIVYIIGLLSNVFDRINARCSTSGKFDLAISVLNVVLASCPSDQLSQAEDQFAACISIALEHSGSENLLPAFVKFIRNSRRYNPFIQIRKILLDNRFTLSGRLQFLEELDSWEYFDRDVLPNIAPFLLRLVHCSSVPSSSLILTSLTRLRLSRIPPPDEPCDLFLHQSTIKMEKSYPQNFVNLDCADLSDGCGIVSSEKCATLNEFQQWFLSELEKATCVSSMDDGSLSMKNVDSSLLILVLSFIRPLPLRNISTLLKTLSGSAMATLGKEFQTGNPYPILLQLLILVETRWDLFGEHGEFQLTGEPFADIDVFILLEISSRFCLVDTTCAILALRCADIVFCARSLHDSIHPSCGQQSTLFPLLLTCLKSYSHQTRLHSLRILGVIFGNVSGHEKSSQTATLSVLSRCLQAERAKLDAQSVREFLVPILHLHAHREGIKGEILSTQIAMNYLLGVLHIQLTSIWPGIQEAVASYSELPRARRDLQVGESKGSTSAPDVVPSEDWCHVACRIYWSVMEPMIERSANQTIGGIEPHSSVSDNNVVRKSPDENSLQNTFRYLTCDKLNFGQLRVNIKEESHTRRFVDWQSYCLSLWRCLRPFSAGKKTRLLVPLLLKRVRHHLNHGFKKEDEQWLLIALDLFSKFPNINSVYQEAEFRSMLYELLSNPRPSVQKGAFRCLLAYKNVALNNYSEHLEKIIDLRTFRDEIRTFKLDVAIRDTKHRLHVAPIFLRILYGRLQLSKGMYAAAVFTNLAACSQSEFHLFLELLLQPLLSCSFVPIEGRPATKLCDSDIVSFIQTLRDRVCCINAGPDALSWSRLQALSKVLNHILDYMGHRLNPQALEPSGDNSSSGTQHLEVLFRLGLYLVSMTQSATELVVNGGEKRSFMKLPHPTQIKRVRVVAVRLLEFIFNSNLRHGEFFTSADHADAVRNVCFYQPMLTRLTNSSTVSVNHLLLTLSLPWSMTPHLAVKFFPGPGLDTLMSLLVSKRSSNVVAERLVQIVYNLIFVEGMEEVGRELVRPHHVSLIRYLHDRMRQLSQIKTLQIFRQNRSNNHGLRLCQEFKILGYLASCASQDTTSSEKSDNKLSSYQADWLLSGLLSVLTKCTIKADQLRKRRVSNAQCPSRINSDESASVYEFQKASTELIEADLIHAISRLVSITDNYERHLIRILSLFKSANSRVCRSLLCESVKFCTQRLSPLTPDTLSLLMELSPNTLRYLQEFVGTKLCHNLPPYSLCSDILTSLNSWDESRLDQPDTARREHAFGLLCDLCSFIHFENPPSQAIYIHFGGLCCALHTLAHSELQLRDAALEYCFRLISAVQSSNIVHTFYRPLIQRCLWPGLVSLLRDSHITGPKRLHLLRLLRSLVQHFRTQPLFAPLSLLLDFDASLPGTSSSDFFENLQSGSVTRQSQAIRRLALFLRNPLTIVGRREIDRVTKVLNIRHTDFPIPERLLTSFFIPLLFFYLMPQFQSTVEQHSLLLEQKRLINNCLDALNALVRRLSWNSYRKVMDTALSKLKKSTDSSFAARFLMTLIDAFVPPSWFEYPNGRPDDIPVGIQGTSIEPITNDRCAAQPTDIQTDISVEHVHPGENSTNPVKSATTEGQQEILSYMLHVVKLLLPYISKSPKSTGNALESGSKPFNIALVVSLTSLLKRLPPAYLHSRLPHLVLQVVSVLRPSSDSKPKVRMDAIKSLIQVVREIGPGKSLDTLVDIISQQLTRGYAAQQVRLFALHKILGELESCQIGGRFHMQPGQLDKVGRVISHHYFDELVGSLAEEIDSRRAAGYALTSVNAGRTQDVTDLQTSSTGLGGSGTTDLPEASGLKAPEGLSRLCRLLSETGVRQLFSDLESAVHSAATGSGLVSESADGASTLSVGCGLRYRSRALARVDVTLARLPTRNGLFSLKGLGGLSAHSLLSLGTGLIERNIKEVLSSDSGSDATGTLDSQSNIDHSIYGWKQPCSELLEPRWKYLEVEVEPTRDRACDAAAQSEATQSHLLVGCGLQIIVGLLRYRWLRQDDEHQMAELTHRIPLILDCLRSKYVRVSGAALRALNLLLVVARSKTSYSLMPNFSSHLKIAGDHLFGLLSTYSGLLSTKTAATDPYAQQFAANLYRALSSLVSHQSTYPLSAKQLLTLLNAVDIELTRDAAATPSLVLLQAILQRRLRDPNLQKDEKVYLTFTGDMEFQKDGLVVAKPSDKDQLHGSGAGGGARLVDLIQRLHTLVITSPSDHIRAEARCCLVLFLLNYPHQAKFIQTFFAFCLRQLEHKKVIGRSSALSLLTGLIADLPVSRLTANHLDETILVSVGAAIEREPVRALRVGMLALIRLLFTRLPPTLAEAHFREYLLAFITAPSETRSSARLLGLQLVGAVLDCQPCLAAFKHRLMLIKLLGSDVLPTAAQKLHQIVLTTPCVRQMSGLTPLFLDENLCPVDEVARARAALEDAAWVTELTYNSYDNVNSSSESEQGTQDFMDANHIESESLDEETNESEEESGREKMDFEEAEEVARIHCEPLVPEPVKQQAIDHLYLLVAHTLEYALRMQRTLLDITPDTHEVPGLLSPEQVDESLVASDVMIPVWKVITGSTTHSSLMRSGRSKGSKKRRVYALLMSSTDVSAGESSTLSLCCAGHRGAREWATRCLAPLLRLESNANSQLLCSNESEQTECLPNGGYTRSAFFSQLRKKTKLRINLLERLKDDALFQLEHDAKEPLGEQWSDALVGNIVYLGQLLHLSAGRRSVLRLFRKLNRIALDELNHRPQCYIQRTLVLKITTGLLLRLPRPKTEELLSAFNMSKSFEPTDSVEHEMDKPRCAAYVSYLRAASRVIAREFRQRERVAFMAAATLSATMINDTENESAARVRLGGTKLSKEQSARARARRRKAQARLRRALMSGTMRRETMQHFAVSTTASRNYSGPDKLVDVIENAEKTLKIEYGQDGAKLMQLVCAQATRGAKARQQTTRVRKATKEALGMAFSNNFKRRYRLKDNGDNYDGQAATDPKKARIEDQDTCSVKRRRREKL